VDNYKPNLVWNKKSIALLVILNVALNLNISAVSIKGAGIVVREQAKKMPRKLTAVKNTVTQQLSRDIELFIQLSTPAVTQYVNNSIITNAIKPSKKQEQDHAKLITAEQGEIRRSLKNMGVDVLSSMRVGANGLRVKSTMLKIQSLLLLPGVISISPVALHKPTLVKSVPWINTPEVWEQFATGKGVTVAIIDTGIDYLHKNLGGSGSKIEYEQNNKNIIETGTFPTAKVIGGYDFAGANYDPSDPLNSVPHPDPDPLDGDGHGSHVAGIVAGQGVAGKIGPGVAKDALLYALKVFGDVAGSTSLTADAIEWALDPNGDGATDDHVDIINISIGSSFGSPNEPSSIAAQNAAELGVIVVVSASNDGDVPYILGSPAIAPDVIAVAASISGPQTSAAIHIDSPSSIVNNYVAKEAIFTSPITELGNRSGLLVLSSPTDACEPLINSSAINNTITLIERGQCDFIVKAQHALNAGAIGFVVYNNITDAAAIIMSGNQFISIPGYMIGNNDGTLIASTIINGGIVNITFDENNIIATPEFDDVIAQFSSSGPGRNESSFKPDLSAPGVQIISTDVGSGTGATILSGTSMAAPHVAGLAAILHSKFKSLNPGSIKAILQNSTIDANVNPDTSAVTVALTRQGTGVVRADRAFGLSSYASPGGVSFGRINPVENSETTVNFTIFNNSNTKRNYSIQHRANRIYPGIKITGQKTVSVSAYGEEQVEYLLEMDPALGIFDFGFFDQTEIDGWFILKNATEEMRVGYIAVVDPASKIKAAYSGSSILIENKSSSSGYVDGFTLIQNQGILLDKTANAIKSFGFRTNDYFGQNNIVEFALVTELAWDSLSAYQILILIDANNDGVYEKTLVAIDSGFLDGIEPNGIFSTAVFDDNGGYVLFDAIADLNDNSMILPFFKNNAFGQPLGFLPDGNETFDYQLLIFDLATGSVDLQIGSIDLRTEIIPEISSFVLLPETSILQTSNSISNNTDMLWLFQNNEVKKQSTLISR